ncbi:transposase [Planococcus lenghuensis]|uniref:IS1182 family transposase n=1 Tax=Planococcus lenghuensis TaxID=2213202 RepID=A0A1Q2L4V2_9BACL|nr:transposase [Planococcus lenghuensis]AQQ55485.1 IS1182 family transposase [Planococcus lenghuensis]
MPIIRQDNLFDMQELFEMAPTHRFNAIFSTLELGPLLRIFDKKTHRGAPRELNTGAMIYSLIAARVVERIPTIKRLVKRLGQDPFFRFDCGFLLSDDVPSESSYSRMISAISETDALAVIQDVLVAQAIQEGFITEESLAIDATHFEARDKAIASPKKEKPAPKKPGRKSKDEREKWLTEQKAAEEAKTLYEKEMIHLLDESADTLACEMPTDPKWGIKKNSDGKNTFWFGYKAHLAVSTESQYIVSGLMSSGSLNDGKAAIPLLKQVDARWPDRFQAGIMDKGYDYKAVYEQLRRMNLQAVIAYNRRQEGEVLGFNEQFAPTCVREHAYRYDSFDAKYETLKYTRPHECATCPLQHDSLCQKVVKIKRSIDLRKHTVPARSSIKWAIAYKTRGAVERVNAYLKELFDLNNVRHRTGKKAKIHFQLVTLVYNACRMAADRLKRANDMNQAAA